MPLPPEKPRRPAPDARGMPLARSEPVPGVPKQAPSPRAMEAAREASRKSSPEIQDVKLEALTHRVDTLETHAKRTHDSLDRLADGVDGLTKKVSEWELKAAGGEALKVQEEQKTKRWMAVIGVITMIVSPIGAVIGTVVTRDPPPKTEVVKSAMQREEERCQDAPSDDAFIRCVADVAARNAPLRRH